MRKLEKPFQRVPIELLRPVVPGFIVAALVEADRDPVVGNNDGWVDEAELRAAHEAQPQMMITFDYEWSVAEAYERRGSATNVGGETFLRFGALIFLVIGLVRWASEGFTISYDRLAPMLRGEKIDTTMTMLVGSIMVFLFAPRRWSKSTNEGP